MLEAAITAVRVYYTRQTRDWLVLLSVQLWAPSACIRDPDLAANMRINKYIWTHVGPNMAPGESNTWRSTAHPAIHSREDAALNAQCEWRHGLPPGTEPTLSATPRCKQSKNSPLSQASLQSRYIMAQAWMNDITGSPAITNLMSFTTSW